MVQIVIPLYNDWDSLLLLLNQMQQKLQPTVFKNLSFVIVNDGSVQQPPADFGIENEIKIVHLRRNVGHQKAIALGLAVAQQNPANSLIIMDADGEDRPEDIEALLEAAKQQPNRIIFAQRTKRYEGFFFVTFYQLYKLAFKLMTGKTLNFGNFSLIPAAALARLVYVSEIWNHFSGGVMRAKIPYSTLPLPRGKRLAGESKMNFTALVLHGLSAVAVHIETVAVRLLIAFFVMAVLLLGGISLVAYIKFFTPYATPGWATAFIFGSLGIIFQSFFISLFLSFIALHYRTQKMFIPILDYKDYVDYIEERNHR